MMNNVYSVEGCVYVVDCYYFYWDLEICFNLGWMFFVVGFV